MPKPCVVACAKTFLVTYNFLFVMAGASMLSAGLWLHFDRGILVYLKLSQLYPSGDFLTSIAYILMATGTCVSIMAFLGCCGACCESICMLFMYTSFLVLILTSEVVVGILVAVYRTKIGYTLHIKMTKQIKEEYNRTINTSHDLTIAWDLLQVRMQCCGARGPQDFALSHWFNRSQGHGNFVPATCCRMSNTDPYFPQIYEEHQCQIDAILYPKDLKRSEAVKTMGCYTAIRLWIRRHALKFIIALSILILCQIFGFIFSCCMLNRIRREQTKYPWYDDEEE